MYDNKEHSTKRLFMRPIEADALRCVQHIITRLYLKGTKHAKIVAQDENGVHSWQGFFFESQAFFCFAIFEWLLRLPEAEQEISVYDLSDPASSIIEIVYPCNPLRKKYAKMLDEIEARLDSEKSWPTYVTTLRSIFPARIGSDMERETIVDISPEMIEVMVCQLAKVAIFDSKDFSGYTVPGSIYLTDPDTVVLTAYHPLVLLTRLKASYLLIRELPNEEYFPSQLNDVSCQPLMDQLGTWPYLDGFIRQPVSQFFVDNDSANETVYSVDQRYDVLATLTYRALTSTSSVRPINLTTIAEKLVLDIEECLKSDSNSYEKAPTIFIIGSVRHSETKELCDILDEIGSIKGKDYNLSFISSLSESEKSISYSIEYESRTINVDFDTTRSFDDIDDLAHFISEREVVFLIDNFILYKTISKQGLSELPQPDPYTVNPDTVEFDIRHYWEQCNASYMRYEGKLQFLFSNLISKLKALCTNTVDYRNTHLCALLSYSQLSDLLTLSQETREVRKELVSPNSYTTLLRYTYEASQKSKLIYCVNEQVGFHFRLHQWYKMFDPNLRDYDFGQLTLKREYADCTLREIFCCIKFDEKACKVRLATKKVLSEALREKIAYAIRTRIAYGMDRSRYEGVARIFAHKAFTNFLISKSISPKHLLMARSTLYSFYEESQIIVSWSDMSDEDMGIYNRYNENLRAYSERYSDYLLLCSIDKYSKDESSIAQTYQLINAFNKNDGLFRIRQIGRLCYELLRNGYNYNISMRDYFLRVMDLASHITQ